MGLHPRTTKALPGGAPAVLARRECECSGSRRLTAPCSACERQKLLGRARQSTLPIGESGEAYQREADHVAGQVAPAIVHDLLSSPGQVLEPEARAFFEARFQQDFSRVRIHADAKAAESADALGALAFTTGQHIAFSSGRYAPDSASGKGLLAHELSHVVQQGSLGDGAVVQRAPADEPAPAEKTAAASLEPGTAATQEIVIAGQAFDLLVVTSEILARPDVGVGATALAYLDSYPSLGSGAWAFVMQSQSGALCNIGGNCLGWALATFGVNDPPEYVWSMVPQYLQSVGSKLRGSPLETYGKRVASGKIPPHAIWDYFMSQTFQAEPTSSESEAHLAFYGRGFKGAMDGPAHIAFRTAGGELWVSKPSDSRAPVVHEHAEQMSGGPMGDETRLYTRKDGALKHVVVRSKPPQEGG